MSLELIGFSILAELTQPADIINKQNIVKYVVNLIIFFIILFILYQIIALYRV